MVDSVLFIGTVIIAVTQFLKYFVPAITGPVTIAVSALIGLVVALLDTHIGVADITVAQGIMTGLGASGVVYTAGRINSPVVPVTTKGVK